MPTSAAPRPGAPVNLNTATLEELTQLPRVGQALAQRIIAARPFKTVRDLILVAGVGPKVYASLLPLLTVSAAEEPPPSPPEPALASPLEAAPVRTAESKLVESPRSESGAPEIIENMLTASTTPEPARSVAEAASQTHGPKKAAQASLPPPVTDRLGTMAHTPPLVQSASPSSPLLKGKPASPRPSLFRRSRAVNPGSYPVRMGVYTRPRRSRYSLPGETKWRVTRLLFYAIIGLALGGLGLLVFAWSRSGAVPPTSVALVTLRASTPAPPTAAGLIPTMTSPAVVPLIPPAPTVEASATLGPTSIPSVTSAPTDTPEPSPTPAPTSTFTPAPLPTATPIPTSTSTPTPAPTNTPVITPPAGAGELVFAESFEPPRYYWSVGYTNFSRSEFRDGQLVINVNRPSLAYVVGNMKGAQDFYYQTTTRAGPCGARDHYGLQVRAPDNNNFYLFGVTCEGKVRIQVLLKGKYSLLVDAPPNPAVKTGEGAVNVLAVRAAGGDFQFLANGEQLATLTNTNLPEGRFGLYAKALNSPVFSVAFDDVRAWTAAP